MSMLAFLQMFQIAERSKEDGLLTLLLNLRLAGWRVVLQLANLLQSLGIQSIQIQGLVCCNGMALVRGGEYINEIITYL